MEHTEVGIDVNLDICKADFNSATIVKNKELLFQIKKKKQYCWLQQQEVYKEGIKCAGNCLALRYSPIQ